MVRHCCPAPLGGKIRTGVFSTRSPYRPNSLGLSCVKLIDVIRTDPEAPVLLVGGADILDKTPIYDIKPYIPYTDCHPEASEGFAVNEKESLHVEFPSDLLALVAADKQSALLEVLSQDPRGSYEKQPGYVYGLRFADYDIRFTVEGTTLTVFEVLMISDNIHKIK